VVTVDGRLALLGSANMDTRSFRINFELSLLVYDEKVVGQLVDTFDKTAGQSVAVSAHVSRAPVRHFAEGLCRVLSPLL
jgi:cardiolipin synthase